MGTLSAHHKTLTNGVGKCSVPMWSGGVPAGFCDEPAYGPEEPGQQRYGAFIPTRGEWRPHYVPALACYAHGGPNPASLPTPPPGAAPPPEDVSTPAPEPDAEALARAIVASCLHQDRGACARCIALALRARPGTPGRTM